MFSGIMTFGGKFDKDAKFIFHEWKLGRLRETYLHAYQNLKKKGMRNNRSNTREDKAMLKLYNLPIIIGCTLGLFVVFKGNELGNSGWGIVIALIGVAGTLVLHFFQFRKDSNTIGKLKEDTSTIIPEVKNIEENTKKIREQVIEKMVPSLDQIMETKIGVAALVDELKYQKRLKCDMLPYIHNMDSLIYGIQNIYEENAKLSSEIKDEKLLSQRLILDNSNLRQELDTYKNRTKNHDQGFCKTNN